MDQNHFTLQIKLFSYPSWQNYSKFGNVTSIEKSMINPATGFDLRDMKFC